MPPFTDEESKHESGKDISCCLLLANLRISFFFFLLPWHRSGSNKSLCDSGLYPLYNKYVRASPANDDGDDVDVDGRETVCPKRALWFLV